MRSKDALEQGYINWLLVFNDCETDLTGNIDYNDQNDLVFTDHDQIRVLHVNYRV
jgi:hypothetical protein